MTYFKTMNTLESGPFNTYYGRYYGNMHEIGNGFYFIKDFSTGKFVQCNFNPYYVPITYFFDEKTFLCPEHLVTEDANCPASNNCSLLKSAGYPFRPNTSDNGEGCSPHVYGFHIHGGDNPDELLKIDYIIFKPRKRYIDNRASKITKTITKNPNECGKYEKWSDKTYINRKLPKEVFSLVMRIIATYNKNRYGKKVSYMDLKQTKNSINAVMRWPYEPSFFELENKIPELKKIDSKSSSCFEELCSEMNLSSWPTLRRVYKENTDALVIAKKASEIFHDKNILNEIIQSEHGNIFVDLDYDLDCDFALDLVQLYNCEDKEAMENKESAIEEERISLPVPNFEDLPMASVNIASANEGEFPEITHPTYTDVSNGHINSLMEFYRSVANKKSERSAWNLLQKNLESYGKNKKDINDAAFMFFSLTDFLSDEEKNKILKEGLSLYNHNLLSNIGFRCREKICIRNGSANIEYTDKEKELEANIYGYEFRLAENPLKIYHLGEVLNNCVGSYVKKIQKKKCLIVYAQKNGVERICIEVIGDKVNQSRGKNNSPLEGNDLAAFNKWLTLKKLKFQGNHF